MIIRKFQNTGKYRRMVRARKVQHAKQGIFERGYAQTPLEELAYLVFQQHYDQLPDDEQTYLVAWVLAIVEADLTPALTDPKYYRANRHRHTAGVKIFLQGG